MKIKNLHDLYINQLRDVYYAEKKLVKSLPKMAKAASHPDLVKAFQDHKTETELHVERLQQVFEMLEISARAETCEAMDGLVEEATEVIDNDTMPDSVRDAGLIMSAQKVEHYEIAAYGTLITWAEQMGYKEQAAVLKQTLAQEEAADKKLTRLAETAINSEADRQAA